MTKVRNLYGNIAFYHPDGHFMFFNGERKLNWYLDRDLAEVIYIDEEGYKHARLKFTPNGYGLAGTNDPFFLSFKKNRCVVTGIEDPQRLSRHHVIPFMFRKHFPMEVKSKNHHDVVLIEDNTHSKYEYYAELFKDQLAYELNLPTLNQYCNIIDRNRGIVRTLKYNRHKLPQDKKEKLEGFFYIFNNDMELNDNNLDMLEKRLNLKNKADCYGKLVVNKIDDLQTFCERWRQHFVDWAQPRFLPQGWSVKKSIYLPS